ncbi:hypothetical protein GV828_04880 [Flavobacterium sp. NST-5]|uniref:Uncharacterized protein n=1 Tax=Flavobacterium ichthyis TaxID=2698827 RepID=A0ABW9Z6P6_9FLAO|nr:hypothetical protein [Flavobacterium ichthyis]NBL64533.1 hypothetical protein [Flavobacterium ichthyis]
MTNAVSDFVSIVSVYDSSHSLRTGFPRYQYCGRYYQFTRNGIVKSSEKLFKVIISMNMKDEHDKLFVIKNPILILPKDTLANEQCFNLNLKGV